MDSKKIEVEKLDLPFMKSRQRADFIKIDCPSCQSLVAVENIDLTSKIGKCMSCQAIFSVEDKLLSLQDVELDHEEIKRPEGVESYHFGDDLEIEILQPLPILDVIILSLFPFVFIISTLLYFIKGFSLGLTVSLISIAFLAKSILRISRKKDCKIHIEVNKEEVIVRYRPNYLRKDKVFSVSDIDQVYAAMTHDGAALFFIIDGPDGQRHEKVLSRINNAIQLKYIEQKIEKHLNIENREITGAL